MKWKNIRIDTTDHQWCDKRKKKITSICILISFKKENETRNRELLILHIEIWCMKNRTICASILMRVRQNIKIGPDNTKIIKYSSINFATIRFQWTERHCIHKVLLLFVWRMTSSKKKKTNRGDEIFPNAMSFQKSEILNLFRLNWLGYFEHRKHLEQPNRATLINRFGAFRTNLV